MNTTRARLQAIYDLPIAVEIRIALPRPLNRGHIALTKKANYELLLPTTLQEVVVTSTLILRQRNTYY